MNGITQGYYLYCCLFFFLWEILKQKKIINRINSRRRKYETQFLKYLPIHVEAFFEESNMAAAKAGHQTG